MQENHKIFQKEFFWKFLDKARPGPTILAWFDAARPIEQ